MVRVSDPQLHPQIGHYRASAVLVPPRKVYCAEREQAQNEHACSGSVMGTYNKPTCISPRFEIVPVQLQPCGVKAQFMTAQTMEKAIFTRATRTSQ
jgi:hypothetical protein